MVMKGRALPLLSLPPFSLMACTSPATSDLTEAFFRLFCTFSMSFFLEEMLAL